MDIVKRKPLIKGLIIIGNSRFALVLWTVFDDEIPNREKLMEFTLNFTHKFTQRFMSRSKQRTLWLTGCSARIESIHFRYATYITYLGLIWEPSRNLITFSNTLDHHQVPNILLPCWRLRVQCGNFSFTTELDVCFNRINRAT